MPRSRRRGGHVSIRGSWRDRHGRGLRSPVTGPELPVLRTRADLFDQTIASAAEYLRGLWPDELDRVSFEVAALPARNSERDGIDRWSVLPDERRVIFYRLPIERLAHLHEEDEYHQRALVEGCVYRAVAELLGKDPWDLAPDRYAPH
ncbi:metallopeptidase family protein [Clavibacter michiganensis]|uniref:metallopeptidase family protein n=1 Tax=Clavibacter michiganensis TaxID=28447 RepID=UPI003DA0294E